MRASRSWSRRTAAVAAVGGLVVVNLFAPSGARAQPAPEPAPGPVRDLEVSGGITAQAAEALAERLGDDRTGGFWFDRDTGRMVVAVTDDAAAKAVTDADGVAERVTYSTAELDAVITAFNGTIDISGTAFGVEDLHNRVFVEADVTVDEAEYARLAEIIAPYGDAVTLRRVGGEITPMIQGGRFITPNRGDTYESCSVGFNVRSKRDPNSLSILTAGHCTKLNGGVRDWFDGNDLYVGYDAGGSFPGDDYGLIRHFNADISKPGNVWLHSGNAVQDITYSRDARRNELVCASGWKSGYRCGTVLGRNVTAIYPDYDGDGNKDYVWELDYTSLCSAGGDSGGSVFITDAALGLVSGGYVADSGCRTYVQPVNEALAWYGVEVY